MLQNFKRQQLVSNLVITDFTHQRLAKWHEAKSFEVFVINEAVIAKSGPQRCRVQFFLHNLDIQVCSLNYVSEAKQTSQHVL